jgi:hypothetical protein
MKSLVNLSLNGLQDEQRYRNVNLVKNPFFGHNLQDPTQIYGWVLTNGSKANSTPQSATINLNPGGGRLEQIEADQSFSYPGAGLGVNAYTIALFYKPASATAEWITVTLLDGDTNPSKNFLLNTTPTETDGYILDAQSFSIASTNAFKVRIDAPSVTAVSIKGIAIGPGEVSPRYLLPRFATDADLNKIDSSLATLDSGKEPLHPMGTVTQYWRGDKTWQTLNFDALQTHPTTWSGYGLPYLDADIKQHLLVGSAGGIAPLGSDTKISTIYLPDAVLGAMNYQGVWNATTNSPALASGVGTKGWYYKVATAGTTSIDGNANWTVGDLIVFDGVKWDQIQGGSSDVLSVNGQTGTVNLTTANISENGNLYFTNARAIGATLSGFTPTSGSVTASDTILQAIQKLDYNVNHITAGVTSVNTFTGAVSLSTTDIPEGSNLYFTNARAIDATLSGFSEAPGTVTAMDSVLTAIEKLSYSANHLSAGNSYSYYQKTNVGNPPGYFDMTFNGGDASNFIGYYFRVTNGNLVCIHPCVILLIVKASIGNSPVGTDQILKLTASLDGSVIDEDYWRIHGDVPGGTFILPAQTSISLVRNIALNQVLKLTAEVSGNGPDNWANTYSSISVIVLPSVVLPSYQPPPPTSATITPNPAYAQVGQTVTFTVTSDGDTLSYQWSRNGSNIAGATNASYTTGVLTAGNNGDNYSCHIYNSSGFVDVSSSLQVTAAGAPTIVTQPQDYEGLIGDTVQLDIVATGATSWQWQRSSTLTGTYTNLTDGASYSGTTTASLIDNGNIGFFRCIVSNSYGSVTSNSAKVVLLNDGGTCPAAYTLIDTPLGQMRADQLTLGSLVYGYEVDTMTRGIYPVTGLRSEMSEVWTLETTDGRKVDFTPGHEFFTQRGFVGMRDLVIGDTILGDEPGEFKSRTLVGEQVPIIKVEIGTAHTMITSGLLSHNSPISPS